jgi:acyl-CoA thioester hydrolase
LRFSDQDSLGHVNNVAYAALFESGRVDYIRTMTRDLPFESHSAVLASVHIDYLQEMFFPGDVQVATRVAHVGNSSYTLEGLALKDGTPRATARAVLVSVDPARREKRPIPDDFRTVLLANLQPAAQ